MLSSRPHHILTEGTYHAPTKTPSRSKALAENIIYAGSRTVGPKGKIHLLRTPFGPGSTQPSRLLKDGLATQGKPGTSVRQNRPLGDKTPFPNRASNFSGQDGFVKVPKLVLLETAPQPVAASPELERPSSTRKQLRSRKSNAREFETPVNNGRHWDVGDIDIASPELQVQPTIPEDDFDEIEYMPPNTLDLAYETPIDFDLPDYTALGATFRQQVFSAPYDDVEPPKLIAPVFENQVSTTLTLRELEDDDPFRLAKPQTVVPTKGGAASKAPTSRTRPVSVAASSATIRGTGVAARNRPATAASSVANPRAAPRPATAASQVAKTRAVTRPASVAASAAAPAAPAAKLTVTSRATLGRGTATSRTAPVSRTASVSRTVSNPTTARLTPALRNNRPVNAKAAKAMDEPKLFNDAGLDLDDDFMFEV